MALRIFFRQWTLFAQSGTEWMFNREISHREGMSFRRFSSKPQQTETAPSTCVGGNLLKIIKAQINAHQSSHFSFIWTETRGRHHNRFSVNLNISHQKGFLFGWAEEGLCGKPTCKTVTVELQKDHYSLYSLPNKRYEMWSLNPSLAARPTDQPFIHTVQYNYTVSLLIAQIRATNIRILAKIDTLNTKLHQ